MALTGTNATAIMSVPGINMDIQAAAGMAYQMANSQAYKTVFLSTIAFSGLSIIMLF